MAAMVPDDAEPDFDLLAASLRAGSGDLGAFVESLASKLEEAMPAHTRVERRRAGMFGPKLVRRITVDAGDQRLELVSDGSALRTRRAKLSAGIVLKNDELDTDAWLEALGEGLAAEARRSESTRQALQRLLIE